MTAFIIKSGMCMILLFGLYWLFLRKERLFSFNRFFLISSLLISLAVPFLSFSINLGHGNAATGIITRIMSQAEIHPEQTSISASAQGSVLQINPVESPSQSAPVKPLRTNYRGILIFIYLSGFTVMLIRFCRNLILLHRVSARSEKIDHGWYTIALLDFPVNPFSFLHTIYLSKADYHENKIAENVLRHEMEHVKQSHSGDVIFFELLHIIFWFNPVLFMYKSAARINHEYLADEAVVRNAPDTNIYANELIRFISLRTSVPYTSGFSPSMIRLRLMMLNTNSTRMNKIIRITGTLLTSVVLMSILSVQPAYSGTQVSNDKNRNAGKNKDIVIDEVNFMSTDFLPQRALFVMDGRKFSAGEVISFDPHQIKTIDILKGRKAVRKYGKSAIGGAVEVSTYRADNKSEADSLKYKPVYTLNEKVAEGTISIPESNLYSLRIWTYPVFPNQDLQKRWRTIEIMTRDYYRISGKAVQNDGEPVSGALLTIRDTPVRVLTDNNGRFLISDVRPGAIAELSADGFEPFLFKIKGEVFTSELTIALDKKNEHSPDSISKYRLEDFSGSWKINQEKTLELNKDFLKELPNQKFNYVNIIRQYDSDSIMITTRGSSENTREYENTEHYALNSVRTERSALFDNLKILVTCSVAPEGRSFSVTTNIKSSLGLHPGYMNTVSYSLSDDKKQLLQRIYYPGPSSPSGKEIQILVFDRI